MPEHWNAPSTLISWVIGMTVVVTSIITLAHAGPLPTQKIGPPLIGNESSVLQEQKPLVITKRNVQEDDLASNSEEDEESSESDEPYPMLISKKSAKVLNQLVAALQNSLGPNVVRTSDFLSDKQLIPVRSSPNYELFNLQRRNQKDRKNYLRCYFNAVSCF